VEFLLRLVIAAAIMVAPILLIVIRAKRAETGLLLLFPMVGIVPAAAAAAILFVPIEQKLHARGLDSWITPAVIVAGASVIWIFMLGMASAGGPAKLRRLFNIARKDPANFFLPMIVWMVLGGLWGALWRLSGRMIDWIGFST
jgi:hypothetical protein